jgi:predicted PurR-regulated permease PerM
MPTTAVDGVRPSTAAEAEPTRGRADTVRIDVPLRSIVRVALALLVIWLCVQIWNVFLLVLIGFLLAAALAPPAEALERRGWPTGGAVAAVVLALVAAVALALGLIVPHAIGEGRQIAADLPAYVDRAERLLRRYPALEEQARSLAERSASNGSGVSAARVLAIGTGIATGIANTLFVLALAVYLLLDGERVYGWVAGYLSPVQQIRVRRAMPEVVKIVSGYVLGQAITSLLFGAFAFVVLFVAGVPGALLLAVLAGLLDAIPLVGVPVATIPAVLLALTVSVPTAAIVLGLYVAYQQVENYLIVPRIYGKSLRVSPVGILVAVYVGGQLLGIVGILLALPLAAAIPVVERIWRVDVRAEDRLRPAPAATAGA